MGSGRNHRPRLVVLAGVLLVGACGGGAGGEPPAAAASEAAAEPVDTTLTGHASRSASTPEAVLTDFGADDETIRVGLLADLSGPFAAAVRDIVEAQQVYWERVNERGGIAGRRIEVVVEDTRYDVAIHKQRFHTMKSESAAGVLIISQSTGSPHTAAISDELAEAHMVAIPLSFYSALPDPDFGRNVFETYTNFCFESINALDFLAHELGVRRVAIVSFPGEYGQDGARGAKLAAEALGLEVVYDGEAEVAPPSGTNPNPDHTGVVASIVATDPDLVWTAVNPATLAVLMSQTAVKGFTGAWSGNFPSYHESLLRSDVKELIDRSFYLSSLTATFGTDVPGMAEMVAALRTARPDRGPSDYFVFGWTEAQVTEAILRHAAARGDLTRTGVERAAFDLEEVDFGGLAPAQSWKGDPDDFIVRESYMFKPRLSLHRAGPIGAGSTGTRLLAGPFSSPHTDAYSYARHGACFDHAG